MYVCLDYFVQNKCATFVLNGNLYLFNCNVI